jgi:GLPGLI family protein
MTDFYKKNLNNYPDQVKSSLIKEFQGIQKQLVINDNKSVYTSFENEKDVVEKSPDKVEGNVTTKTTRTLSKTVTDYYKDITNNTLLIEKKIRDKEIVIKNLLHNNQWKLTNLTKKINDLECKQALGKDDKGREVVAWYSEDIPVNNGPAEYGGLPGLIVYLESYSWIYEMQELQRTSDTNEISLPSEKEAITMEEYKKSLNTNGGIKRVTKTSKRKS